MVMNYINTLRPRHNGRHCADDIFKCIFLNENVWIPIKFSLKFVPKGSINYIPALVQIMAWRRRDDKPLFEPMMISLLTHICVTRPHELTCNDVIICVNKLWLKLDSRPFPLNAVKTEPCTRFIPYHVWLSAFKFDASHAIRTETSDPIFMGDIYICIYINIYIYIYWDTQIYQCFSLQRCSSSFSAARPVFAATLG